MNKYRVKYWNNQKREFWRFVDFSSKREAVEAAKSLQGAPRWQVWKLDANGEEGEMVSEGSGGWN